MFVMAGAGGRQREEEEEPCDGQPAARRRHASALLARGVTNGPVPAAWSSFARLQVYAIGFSASVGIHLLPRSPGLLVLAATQCRRPRRRRPRRRRLGLERNVQAGTPPHRITYGNAFRVESRQRFPFDMLD